MTDRRQLPVFARWVRAVFADERTAGWHPPEDLVLRHNLGAMAYALGHDQFRDWYAASAATHGQRVRVIAELGRQWQALGIPAALIKGAAYAGTLYEDPAVRPMVDTDVLIGSENIRAAAAALIESGFRRVGANRKMSSLYHAVVFERDGQMVELHRSMLQKWRSRLAISDLWVRSSDAQSGWRTLDPADQLLLCVLHIARHELAVPLLAYLDVAKQIDLHGPGIVGVVEGRAKHYRVKRAVRAVLAMTEVLRTGAPPTRTLMGPLFPTQDEILLFKKPERRLQLARKLLLTDNPVRAAGLAAAWVGAIVDGRARAIES